MNEIFSKKIVFYSWHQNKIQYFLPIFRVNIAEDSGDVPSNICINIWKLLCTSSYGNIWSWLCCTARIGSFQTRISVSRTKATWGEECIFKRGKVWTRTISQWWQYDKFLHRIEILKAVFCALKPTATTMIRWTQMQRQGADLEKWKKRSWKS